MDTGGEEEEEGEGNCSHLERLILKHCTKKVVPRPPSHCGEDEKQGVTPPLDKVKEMITNYS